MSLEYFIVISGIFGKSNDLDILPPPPPFPDIGMEDKEIVEPKIPKKKEEISKKRKLEIEGREKEKRKEELKFRQKQEKTQKKLEKEKPMSEPESEIPKAKGQILSRIDDRKIQKPERKTIFGKFFGKKEKIELDKELGDLEKLNVKEETNGKKLEIPVFEFPEIEKNKKEIQKAISGLKVKKRSFIPKNLFKKKERVEGRIETPEVMPRTYDKIDYVEEIEVKMHKARLALMDFKFEEAKSVYIEIMRMYNQLESKKRLKVYQDIKDLYYERKSAEKFAKK